jgi:hypothetical protein
LAISFNLRKILDRKEWEMMTACPTANALGMFSITDPSGEDKAVMYVCSTSTIYRYDHNQDAWQLLPASGIAGVFGAGSCGTFHHHGSGGTATGGTTTTIITNLTINRSIAGYKVRITAGVNAGEERTILSNTMGTNCVIAVDVPYSNAITATSVYLLLTGRYWVFNAGTSAVGFAYYDRALNTWTQKSVTGLPTAFGTEGRLCQTFSPSGKPFATGTSSGTNSTTTLNNSSKAWTVNQWANFQIRVTSGTGVGQTRTVSSNTGTVITVSSVWTITPDGTSQYVIEGNDDNLYLLGNNAVTMYKYSIIGNTWTTVTPSVARGGALAVGGGANWVSGSTDANWVNENTIVNGRRIYSFRGGAGALLDYYDIPSNSWVALTYTPQADTFTTGSCYDYDEDYIYISKEATGRLFRYIVSENRLIPFSTLVYPDSTAVVGDKMWTKTLTDGYTTIKWIYRLRSTGTELFRCMMIDNDTNTSSGGWFVKEI